MSLTKVTFNMIEGAPQYADDAATVAATVNTLSYTAPGVVEVSDTLFYGATYSPFPSVGIQAKYYTLGTVTANTEQSAVDYKRIKYTGDRFVDINNNFGENHGSGEVGLFTGTVQGWGTGNIIGFTGEAQAKVATIPYTYAADLRLNNDFAPTVRASVVNAVTKGTVGPDQIYYSGVTGAAPKYHFYSAGLAGTEADIYLIGKGVLQSSTLGKATIGQIKDIHLPVAAWSNTIGGGSALAQVNSSYNYVGWTLRDAFTDSITASVYNSAYDTDFGLALYMIRTGAEATGNIVLQIVAHAVADGGTIGTPTENTSITVTVPAQNAMKSITAAITGVLFTAAANSVILLRVTRLGTDVGDTFTGSIQILGGKLIAS